MRALLVEVSRQSASDHVYLSRGERDRAAARLAGLGPDSAALLRWEAHLRLGEQEQHVGNELAAIQQFESALALMPDVREDIGLEWVIRLHFRLGLAYLRFGETQNCALRHAPESCILPVRGSGIHADPRPSRTATSYFERVLELAPEGSDPYLSSRWLLNLAYMTIGEYPGEVPEPYRISPERFHSDADFPRFPNRAAAAGVATMTLSGGVVAEDFDHDGTVDLLVSSYHPSEPLRLFVNRGDGSFADRSDAAGLGGITGGLNMVQGDYDADGDQDVLVLRGAWLGRAGRHPNSLLRNNGDGTFTDVTLDTALGEQHWPTQAAAWVDYDSDGDLDLYVGNESNRELRAPSQLFDNRGDGSFADIAAEAGVENLRFAKGVAFGDYDADRHPDLFVSNLDGENRLYRNRGDGTFVDVAPELGLNEPIRSFPTWFWDFDNDGNLDLFVSAYEASIADLARYHGGGGYAGERSRSFRGDGRGGLIDVAVPTGLAEPSAPMGANYGDLDNDGFPDVYLGTGYPDYHSLMPNALYWNRGGARFDDVTTNAGVGHLQKGHAVAFVDVDGDGDQDLFEQMGGALAGDEFMDVLYENPGFGHRWIALELSGVVANRSGVGARVEVRVERAGGAGERSIHAVVDSGGSFGANPVGRRLIGLGDARRVLWVEIEWPAPGGRQRLADVALDSALHVKEGVERPFVVPYGPRRPRLPSAGPGPGLHEP